MPQVIKMMSKKHSNNSLSSVKRVLNVVAAAILGFVSTNSLAIVSDTNSYNNPVDISAFYSYSVDSQDVLGESSASQLDSHYHQVGLDFYFSDLAKQQAWSFGLSSGQSDSDQQWLSESDALNADVSLEDWSTYLSFQWQEWTLLGSFQKNEYQTSSGRTRYFPNRMTDYLNVEAFRAIESNQSTWQIELSRGWYLDKKEFNWWFNMALAVAHNDSETQTDYRQTNVLNKTNRQLNNFIRNNPEFTPGVIRTDQLVQSESFWSQDLSISLSYYFDLVGKDSSLEPWLSITHYDSASGSVSYARNYRNRQLLRRQVQLTEDNQLIADSISRYYGLDWQIGLNKQWQLGLSLSDSPEASLSWQISTQFLF